MRVAMGSRRALGGDAARVGVRVDELPQRREECAKVKRLLHLELVDELVPLTDQVERHGGGLRAVEDRLLAREDRGDESRDHLAEHARAAVLAQARDESSL